MPRTEMELPEDWGKVPSARSIFGEENNARMVELEEALRNIAELTKRRQLPLTIEINDLAQAALKGNRGARAQRKEER